MYTVGVAEDDSDVLVAETELLSGGEGVATGGGRNKTASGLVEGLMPEPVAPAGESEGVGEVFGVLEAIVVTVTVLPPDSV